MNGRLKLPLEDLSLGLFPSFYILNCWEERKKKEPWAYLQKFHFGDPKTKIEIGGKERIIRFSSFPTLCTYELCYLGYFNFSSLAATCRRVFTIFFSFTLMTKELDDRADTHRKICLQFYHHMCFWVLLHRLFYLFIASIYHLSFHIFSEHFEGEIARWGGWFHSYQHPSNFWSDLPMCA